MKFIELKSSLKTKSLRNRLGKWLISPAGIVFIISATLLLVSLVAAYHIRAYTSDDVVWQNALLHWRPFNGQTYLSDGAASYIAKVPLYWVLLHILSPGRRVLLLAASILIIANFSLFYWSVLYFWNKWNIKIKWQNLMPLIWLSAMGFAMTSLFLSTNLHNIEVGFIFVFFVFASMILNGEFRPFDSAKNIILSLLGSALLGLMIIDDNFFIYYCLVPIIGAIVYQWCRRITKLKTLYYATALLVISLIWAKLIELFAKASGIHLLNNTQLGFVAIDNIVQQILTAFQSLFTMFGADLWGSNIATWASRLMLINAVFLIIVLVAVFNSLRHAKQKDTKEERYFQPKFFGLLFLYIPIIYIVSGHGSDPSTYRYFILLPFIAVILLPELFNKINKRIRILVLIVLSASILAGLISSIGGIKHSSLIEQPYPDPPYVSTVASTSNPKNTQNFALITLLTSLKVNKGYAGYWDANINTYLSKGKITFLPATCTSGQTERFNWLVDTSNFNIKSERSFYLYDPTQAALGYNCTTAQLVKQFGQPNQQVSFESDTLLIYNYDISSKISN